MNSDIFRLEEPSEALPLFDGWDETIVWSALDGTMGEIYANRAMTAACAVLGDFAFLASPGQDEAAVQALLDDVQARTDHALILVAPDEAQFALCRSLVGEAEIGLRYATRKETGAFDPARLHRFAEDLPAGYALSGMTPEIWEQIREKSGWMRDFISNFADYASFSELALGVFALKDGEIVCGASAYSAFDGGIEAHLRKYFACQCDKSNKNKLSLHSFFKNIKTIPPAPSPEHPRRFRGVPPDGPPPVPAVRCRAAPPP